jgi:hypothetical protein
MKTGPEPGIGAFNRVPLSNYASTYSFFLYCKSENFTDRSIDKAVRIIDTPGISPCSEKPSLTAKTFAFPLLLNTYSIVKLTHM